MVNGFSESDYNRADAENAGGGVSIPGVIDINGQYGQQGWRQLQETLQQYRAESKTQDLVKKEVS